MDECGNRAARVAREKAFCRRHPPAASARDAGPDPPFRTIRLLPPDYGGVIPAARERREQSLWRCEDIKTKSRESEAEPGGASCFLAAARPCAGECSACSPRNQFAALGRNSGST